MGAGGGKIEGAEAGQSGFGLSPDTLHSYTYKPGSGSGSNPRGIQRIPIVVSDNYGQKQTKEARFDVFMLPKVLSAAMYYTYCDLSSIYPKPSHPQPPHGMSYPIPRDFKCEVWVVIGRKVSSYPITKVVVSASRLLDTIIPYQGDAWVKLSSWMASPAEILREGGEFSLWLIDSQGNESKAFKGLYKVERSYPSWRGGGAMDPPWYDGDSVKVKARAGA